MHELALTLSINEGIQELCKRSGWARVHRIILKIGGLRQVDPELMAFAFGVVSRGTVTEGAALSVIEFPIVFRCQSCGRDSMSESTAFLCPLCGSSDVELLSGLELGVELIDVEVVEKDGGRRDPSQT